uniref:LMBR1 domain-containing protein 2 n=1 Tax=Ascaris lumbricoides TaxID=6252 RepID=A0A0M3HTB6_ASCLU
MWYGDSTGTGTLHLRQLTLVMFVEWTFVFFVTLFLLHKFGSIRKQHIIVIVSTFIGWFSSFTIITILPEDIAVALYKRCLLEKTGWTDATNLTTKECGVKDNFVSDQVLLSTWRVMYWTAQLLTWIVLPLMQSYSNAGDFTVVGKLRSAAYNNVIYYGAYLIIFVCLLFYAAIKRLSLNAEHVKVMIISASNTWGLFMSVVLLGYGLVEVPRQLWLMGVKGYRLNKTYFDLDKLSAEKNEAEDALKEVYQEARSVLSLLRNDHALREYAQIVLAKFPVEVVTQLTSSGSGSFSAASSIAPSDESLVANEKYLIRLHKRVIIAIQNHHRTQAQWGALLRRAIYLEDVQHADDVWDDRGHCIYDFRSIKKNPSSLQRCPDWALRLWYRSQFAWHIIGKRPAFKISAVFSCLLSLVVIWSECTFFVVHPTLSIAAMLTVALCLISYLCICVYYAVFKLRIYRYYRLDPNHMTDENSLLFSAILLCRLTPALCLNVLGMVHLDSHITSQAKFPVETQFTKLMGHLDVIPILAKGLNIYLPTCILLLCLATYFRLGTRFLHSLGIDQFVNDDEMTAELVQGGKALVTLERNKMLRAANREQRDQYWAERLAGYGTRTQDSRSSSYGLEREASSKNACFPGIREYGDDEPILAADERFERYISPDPHDSRHTNNGSPLNIPPSNIFDDL